LHESPGGGYSCGAGLGFPERPLASAFLFVVFNLCFGLLQAKAKDKNKN